MKQYEMRRAARRMNRAEIDGLLERGEYCVVSCVDANGAPYGVPLSYVYEPAQSGERTKHRFACGNEPARSDECPAKQPECENGPLASVERIGGSEGGLSGVFVERAEYGEGGLSDGYVEALEENTESPCVSGTMYFHTTNEGGRKLDAFAADGRACATVVEDVAARFQDAAFTAGFSSAMAFGRIHRVTDPVVVRKALVGLCMKYLPEHKSDIGAAIQADLDATAVWALDIEELSGKKN